VRAQLGRVLRLTCGNLAAYRHLQKVYDELLALPPGGGDAPNLICYEDPASRALSHFGHFVQ
jgi:hypothetical protein